MSRSYLGPVLAGIGPTILLSLFLVVWPALVVGQTNDALLNLLLSGGQDESGVLPDAFRSDLSGRSGFWWAIPTTDSPEIEFSQRQFEPATSSLGDGSTATLASETRLRCLYPGKSRTWSWQTAAAVRRSRVSSFTDGTNGGVRLVGSGVGVDLGLRIKEDRTHLEFAGVLPLNRDQGDLPLSTSGWGVRFTPGPGFIFQVSQQKIRSRTRVQTRILSEIVDTGLNADSFVTRMGFRLTPWRPLILEVERLDVSITSGHDLQKIGHELLPKGKLWGWNNALYVSPFAHHDLLLRYTRWDSELTAGSYYQGQRYGWLNSLAGNLESRLIGWRWRLSEHQKIVVEYESNHLEFDGNGEIESWPFTETAVDLLGGEQVVDSEGSVDWERYSLTGTLGSRPRSIALGGSYYDLDPGGSFSTWKTALGGIGHSDFQRHEMDTNRIQMASVLLQVLFPIRSTVVDLAVQQFVWVSATSDEIGQEEPPPGGGNETPAAQSSGWQGGTFLSFRVTYSF